MKGEESNLCERRLEGTARLSRRLTGALGGPGFVEQGGARQQKNQRSVSFLQLLYWRAGLINGKRISGGRKCFESTSSEKDQNARGGDQGGEREGDGTAKPKPAVGRSVFFFSLKGQRERKRGRSGTCKTQEKLKRWKGQNNDRKATSIVRKNAAFELRIKGVRGKG